MEDDSDPRQGGRLTPGNLTGVPVLANVFDTRAGLNNPLQEVEAKGFSLLGEWETNDLVMFRAIFASRDDESWSPIDFDSLPEADLDVPVIYENEQTSAELQAILTYWIRTTVLPSSFSTRSSVACPSIAARFNRTRISSCLATWSLSSPAGKSAGQAGRWSLDPGTFL